MIRISLPPGVPLLDIGDFDLRLVPVDGKRDKDHQILAPPDTIAAEGHISDLR
jgi:hypothetical protein